MKALGKDRMKSNDYLLFLGRIHLEAFLVGF